MNKSEVIQELGFKVLNLIAKEANSHETHPMYFEFSPEEQIHNQIRKEDSKRLMHLVLEEINTAYRAALAEESNESNS